jgi:streptogrisin D
MVSFPLSLSRLGSGKETRMKINYLRYGGIGLALAGLSAGGYVVVNGAAQPSGVVAKQAAATPSATSLARRLGGRTAGSYVDRTTGRTVVTVTSQADAALVRAAGKVPKVVRYSGTDLSTVTATLRTAKLGTGTGWGVNPKTDAVSVWADTTVRGAQLTKLRTLLAAQGAKVRFQRLSTPLRTLAQPVGGDAIFGGQVRCSLGFNVHQGSTPFFVTAGHCGNAAGTWFADQAHTTLLGDTVKSTFPGHDFSLVSLQTAGVSAVDLFNGSAAQITTAGDPVVGERVTRSGSTSGVHSGTVLALNTTVNFEEGTVTGMIETNVCAEPGDSGGPLFAGTTALGLTSGGSGDCTQGGITFFQPITQALTTLGVEIGDPTQGQGSASPAPSATPSPTATPTATTTPRRKHHRHHPRS